MPRQRPMTIAELARLVKRGFDRTASKEDLQGLRSELKGDLAGLRSELKADVRAVRADLKRVDRDLHGKLDGIVKGVKDLMTEGAANQAAHRRFEHRDQVFAEKLQVNLNQVDAEG